MNNDIRPTTETELIIPTFQVSDDALQVEYEMAIKLAEIRSLERPVDFERPMTMYVTIAVVGFFALLFSAGALLVPNFFALKTFHGMAASVGLLTGAVMVIFHQLGVRARNIT